MSCCAGVGFSADFQTRSGVPAPVVPSSPLVALRAAAQGEVEDDDDDSDVEPVQDAGNAETTWFW